MKFILGNKFEEQLEKIEQSPSLKSAADSAKIADTAQAVSTVEDKQPVFTNSAKIDDMLKTVFFAQDKQPVSPDTRIIDSIIQAEKISDKTKTDGMIKEEVSVVENKQPALPVITDAHVINTIMQSGKISGITQEEVLSARRQFLYEVVEKRETNGKHYTANDGTVTAIFQNQAVHYLDPSDNKFKDIDSSLHDAGNYLEANVNDFNIQFDKTSPNGKVFELTKKDCKVSLISIETAAVKAGLKVENKESEIILKNIKDSADFKYVVESDRVKENIIINKKSDVYEYNFDLNIENMYAGISDDGKTLQLKSKKTGELMFFIPVPFMTDANGEYSDLVYYEIADQSEKTLNLKVVASAQWLNSSDRVFPATVNPQIVAADKSLFKYQVLPKGTSGLTDDTFVLTVNNSSLNFDDSEKISKATLKLSDKTGVYYSFDITDMLVSAGKKDFNIEIKPDFTIKPYPVAAGFEIQPRLPVELLPPIAHIPPIFPVPPFLEVEYLTSDDSMPAKEDFALAGGVKGTLNMTTGEFVTGFTDASTKSSALACRISHVHKKNSTDYGCGKNWRLNLHQTLVKSSIMNFGVDYIYTDSAGEKHGFIETYYYLHYNAKVAVAKKDVTVKLDGSLWYESVTGSHEVFKEQRTATGLKLSVKMEGFKNIEYLEQRQKEQKQLEEYIEACKNNFKEYVIMQKSDGLILSELKSYFISDALSSAKFNEFTSNGSASGKMILSKGEAIQYASLCLQEKQLNDQITKTMPTQIEALENSVVSLETQYGVVMRNQFDALFNQAWSLVLQRRILSVNKPSCWEPQRDLADRQFEDVLNQLKLIYNITVDKQELSLTIEGGGSGIQRKQLIEQKNCLNTQIKNINVYDIPNLKTQLKAVDGQKNYITGKAAVNLKELKRVFKEYVNKEFELKKLKEQLPVSYLIDGNSSLCFNESGKLCAITDNYDNYVSVEYDNKGRISKVYDGKRATVLKYDFHDKLVSITDYRGRTASYFYSSSGELTNVVYSDGNKLSFAYTGEKIKTIASSADRTETELSYFSDKLSKITNKSAAIAIKDDAITTGSATVSITEISYAANEYVITIGEKLKHCFMDRLGNLIGGYSKLSDGRDEERLSFGYFDRTNNWCYSVKETGDPVKLSGGFQLIQSIGQIQNFKSATELRDLLSRENPNGLAVIKGLQISALPKELKIDLPAFVLPKNLMTSVTVPAASLPAGQIEFVFSAYAAAASAPATDMRFGTKFRPLPSGSPTNKFEIVAEVNYAGKPAQIFVASFDYKNKGKQFCALPVTLDKVLLADLQSIVLKHVYTGSGTAAFTDFRFAPCEWEYKTFDQFKNVDYSENSTRLLNKGENSTAYERGVVNYSEDSNAYEKAVINYSYDNEHRLIKKRAERTVSASSGNTFYYKALNYGASKYYYNDYGSVVRTETYIEGEEGTTGIVAEETVYDEKGNTIRNLVYNTLDSASKGYSESEYSENGQLKAKIDKTGENRTIIEYAPGTDDVQTITNPDGGKFSYGRDYITGAITGMTLSTEKGKANSIETKYTCGVVTRLKSGLNTVNYEYDAKRRKTKVLLNGTERVNYAYEEDVPSGQVTVNNIEFNDVISDKTKATLKGGSSPDIVTEVITDKRGNLISTRIDGQVQFAHNYNSYNNLANSADNITGSALTTTYDDANKRAAMSSRTAGTKEGYEDLAALSESYVYNNLGELSIRDVSIDGTVVQTYVHAYKNNAARNLDSIALPNNLLCKPQTDANGRNIGNLLTDLNGQNKFGEYIDYLKVGDHTTDMISSIRYGDIKNGQYVIGVGLDYKYDVRGNISEIWEDGDLAVAYTYDQLQRLIREDNMSKGKSWFYSYDNNGNILSKKEANYTRKSVDEISEYNYKKLYSYDGDKLTDCGGESFVYDGFGNPVTYRNKALTWQKCKLVGFNGIMFAYDGYGKRVKKANTVYTYDMGNKLLRQSDGENTLEFIYDGSGLSGVKCGNTQYVYRKNIQGDITHIFDINGDLTACYKYDAWGNHTVVDSEGNPITSENHIGNLNPFRYRGYFYDTETNLYFLQNRYYDPEIGRFISQDEISYLDPNTINGLNLYAYCGNNCVMRVDDTGSSWISFFKKIVEAEFWKRAGGVFLEGLKAVGRFVAGVAIAVVGVAIIVAIAAAVVMCPALLLIPGVGFGVQLGVSLAMFGGFVAASSWDNEILEDMRAINWNPFNSNESTVLSSNKVSFYKGVPVIMKSSGRSWSAFFISLNRNTEDREITVKHEWGHAVQAWIMPVVNAVFMLAIPSALKWGPWAGADKYYAAPWEITADMFGGVDRDQYHNGDKHRGWVYFFFATLLGPFAHIITLGESKNNPNAV
ncbi:MAG: hypothetical protein FWG57_05740 [Endomicrobia bacterium]|nr:hypothetical protein [Endomicrobiia bacterium]